MVRAVLAWDGALKTASLQDIAIGHVLGRVAVALHNAPCKTELVELLEEVCGHGKYTGFSG